MLCLFTKSNTESTAYNFPPSRSRLLVGPEALGARSEGGMSMNEMTYRSNTLQVMSAVAFFKVVIDTCKKQTNNPAQFLAVTV